MYSPNMLKTFEQCPRKYHLKYEEKISVPQPSTFFETGKKIHAIANYFLKGEDVKLFENMLSNDEILLWNKLKSNEYFQMSYVNSEYDLSCKVGNFWIGGRIDAIVRNGDNYYILDYKTGQIPKNPEEDYQTIVYLLAVRKFLKEILNLSFVYIDLKNNQNYLIKFDDEKKYNDKIIKICTQIETSKNIKTEKL